MSNVLCQLRLAFWCFVASSVCIFGDMSVVQFRAHNALTSGRYLNYIVFVFCIEANFCTREKWVVVF